MRNAIPTPRPLSDFEAQYVAWRMKPFVIGRWIMGGLGFLLVIPGIGLPLGFIHDGYGAKVVGLMFLLGAAIAGVGALLVRLTLFSKPVADGKTARIAGVLERKETVVVNPRSGSRTTVITYRIGDFLLNFPLGFELVLTPYVGQPVELMAATFSPSRPLTVFGKSFFNESTAIVLTFYDKLNIHRAVEKYGIGFIKKDFYLMTGGGLVTALLLMWIMFTIPFPLDLPVWIVVAMIVGLAVGLVVVLIALAFLADWLEKFAVSRGWMKTRIPYLEKLQG